MSPATQNITDRLRSLTRDQLLRLGPEDLAEIESFLQASEHRRIDSLLASPVASFEEGPLLWLTQYTKTQNPQFEQQSKDKGHPVPFLAPFPRKSYLVHLFQ